MGSVAAVTALAAGLLTLPEVSLAAEPGVEFKSAANGLQWVDTVEGDGKPPVPGSLIRSADFPGVTILMMIAWQSEALDKPLC